MCSLLDDKVLGEILKKILKAWYDIFLEGNTIYNTIGQVTCLA